MRTRIESACASLYERGDGRPRAWPLSGPRLPCLTAARSTTRTDISTDRLDAQADHSPRGTVSVNAPSGPRRCFDPSPARLRQAFDRPCGKHDEPVSPPCRLAGPCHSLDSNLTPLSSPFSLSRINPPVGKSGISLGAFPSPCLSLQGPAAVSSLSPSSFIPLSQPTAACRPPQEPSLPLTSGISTLR